MLFPHCSFKVLVPNGFVYSGQHVEGTLEITSPENIPRAHQIDLFYTATAWAGYGGGKNRTVVTRPMYYVPLVVPLPNHELPAGVHRFPFTLDIPPWLPPHLLGSDCGITHKIETRLEVKWAIDPKSVLQPVLAMAPQVGQYEPLIARTPSTFHEKIVLEVTLASSVVAQDEPIRGQVALRSGADARFDSVSLTVSNLATIVMGRRDHRKGIGARLKLSAAELRSGAPVSFEFPPNPDLVPTFRTAFIDSDVVLSVSVDIPWSTDPQIDLMLRMLPAGSTMHGESSVAPVGSARLKQTAAAMARRTGLAEGRAPVLVEGAVGPVLVRIVDAPRQGKIGIDVELRFPDLELGLAVRPIGLLDGFRDSSLLPESFRARFFLKAERPNHAPIVDDAAISSFIAMVLQGLEGADEIELSDHHLRAHFPLVDDDGARMVELARFIQTKARSILDGILALPFPEAMTESAATWRAVAKEQNAVLVPIGPSIHGLKFGARMQNGEDCVLDVTFATIWDKKGPRTQIELQFDSDWIPAHAGGDLEGKNPGELARAVRDVFPHIDLWATPATLERPGFTADPRTLFPGVEAFLVWALDVRGERRADAPYR